jgi:hypothetical protein
MVCVFGPQYSANLVENKYKDLKLSNIRSIIRRDADTHIYGFYHFALGSTAPIHLKLDV